MRQNQRAERFAQGLSVPTAPAVKQERYEDDERREGRGLQRVYHPKAKLTAGNGGWRR